MARYHRQQTEPHRSESRYDGYNFVGAPNFDNRTGAHPRRPSNDATGDRCKSVLCQSASDGLNDQSCSRGHAASDVACDKRRICSEHYDTCE